MKSTARAVAPRATYLASAIRRRASRGPALPPGIKPNPNNVPFTADSIVVEKSRRTMTLYQRGTPVRIYFIALGQNPLGDKVGLGDNRTPEGLYYIEGHNPASKYHLSLKVSYPNEQDISEAKARGVATGGDIMIHGLPRGFENVGAEHRQRDWTNGCIAVTNAEIEEIWSAIPDGAAIHIKP
jgi:murein L,D-transpeptidase YafK